VYFGDSARSFLQALLPRKVISVLRDHFLGYGIGGTVPSFSQEGEDVLLYNLFKNRKNGCYVDIGAHNPKRFSNTCLFYLLGWRGINVEPDPSSIDEFRKFRKQDINLGIGIGIKEGIMEYYQFNDAALNTFNRQRVDEILKMDIYHLVGTEEVQIQPLSSVLDNHLGRRAVDFLDVDVEGMELEVLMSNNWEKYKPLVVLVEVRENNLRDIMLDDVHSYLENLGYNLVAKTPRTGFYAVANFLSFLAGK